MQICSKVYCDRVYFLCTERIATAGADLAFLQGGGVWPIVHEPRSGEPIFLGGGYFTSREAASRLFFFCDFTSREAASWFFWRFYEPRSGEPIFFGYFTSREAASRFFLAILRAAKRRADFFWLFYEPRSVFSSPGGGGGVKPYCLRLSLRQSAIGTYCVGLDILWWRFFYAH